MKTSVLLATLILSVGAYCHATAATDETAAAAAEPPSDSTADVSEMLAAVDGPVSELYRARVIALPVADMLIVDREGAPVTLRLYGADAPEKGQPGHEAANVFAVEKFLAADVDVYILATDTLGLPVALVVSEPGSSLAHQMVAEGLAWWDQVNAPRDSLLRSLGADAIVAGKGIFAAPDALAPWDYRAGHDIEQYTYAIPKEGAPTASTEATSPAEGEEPRVLRARGDATARAPRPAAPAPAPAPALRPEQTDASIDPSALILKHQPRMERDAAGQVLGLTATNIAAIPYAAQLGFREGDVVARVNGIRLESEAQIMSLIPQLRGVKQFHVEVLRDGRPVTIPISLP